ncbi:MAG: hypothetical protein GX422_07835 [Deltaproteobacteria bacterium]|nr:hypothetical protein [Deltaproteobacteria bacterium]
MTPRPSARHTHPASVLGMEAGSAYHAGRRGPGGWIILDETEMMSSSWQPANGYSEAFAEDCTVRAEPFLEVEIELKNLWLE